MTPPIPRKAYRSFVYLSVTSAQRPSANTAKPILPPFEWGPAKHRSDALPDEKPNDN